MGLFSFISGLLFESTTQKKDDTRVVCSKKEIEQLISHTNIQTLSKEEIIEIEHALIQARKQGEYLSVAIVDHTLHTLYRNKQISEHDYKKVLQVFVVYLAKKKYQS